MSNISYFIITLLLGWIGIHKFAQKKVGMGILYLFTFGLFGIGWFIDIILALINLIQVEQKNISIPSVPIASQPQYSSQNSTYLAKNYIKNANTFASNVNAEIRNLLWFGDGPNRNYVQQQKNMEKISINGYTISFSIYGSEEPSLIYTQLLISKPIDETAVPRLSYYPSYKELTPEQRWMYWKFLENPYTGTHDIGYVFIFYYGLERYLFSGHNSNAFNVILKLRDCYENKSFQSYSSTALILYSIVKKDVALANAFLDSLDKKFEMKIPANLFVLLKYSLSLPLTPFEIMHYSKAFSFNNQHYIKDNPEIFLGFLQEAIKNKYGTTSVALTNLFINANSTNIKSVKIPLFANISIIDKVVTIPYLIDYVPFYSAMYGLLTEAHENTKKYLATLRKNSTKTNSTQLSIK